jgi:hypothetical protein
VTYRTTALEKERKKVRKKGKEKKRTTVSIESLSYLATLHPVTENL